jgi:hypothetical protein
MKINQALHHTFDNLLILYLLFLILRKKNNYIYEIIYKIYLLSFEKLKKRKMSIEFLKNYIDEIEMVSIDIYDHKNDYQYHELMKLYFNVIDSEEKQKIKEEEKKNKELEQEKN